MELMIHNRPISKYMIQIVIDEIILAKEFGFVEFFHLDYLRTIRDLIAVGF